MSLDNPIDYETALKRLIELRFQSAEQGTPLSAEGQRLEQAIYKMVRERANPAPSDEAA